MTGTGPAPDVTVEGILNGSSLGVLCMAWPDILQSTIDLDYPNFEDYFSVTLPKGWVQDGLELTVTAGNENRLLSSADLKIGPYTEMNLAMVNMDVMDYNGAPINGRLLVISCKNGHRLFLPAWSASAPFRKRWYSLK